MDYPSAHWVIAIALWAAAGAFGYLFLGGLAWGSGYMPTPKKEVERALELSKVEDGMKVYELGSGFGGIVMAMAERADIRCVGVEIDPLKCWWSNMMIRRKHLTERAKIVRANLFNVDLSDADIVYLFLMPGVMEQVKRKLWSEMRKGATVVSYWHRFRDWQPSISDDRRHVFVYSIPDAGRLSLGR